MEIKDKNSNLEKILNIDYDSMTKEELKELLIETEIQNYYLKRKEEILEEERTKKKKEEKVRESNKKLKKR